VGEDGCVEGACRPRRRSMSPYATSVCGLKLLAASACGLTLLVYACILTPRYMCPDTTIYLSAYCCMCVLIYTTIHELTSVRVGGLRRSLEALAKRRQRTPVWANRSAPGRPPLKEHMCCKCVLQVCVASVCWLSA